MSGKQRPIADRYWEKVDRRGPDECWPWTGALNKGHGVLGAPGAGTGMLQAHRLAWEFAHGEPPVGVIDHECHNRDDTCPGGVGCLHRRCQNPAHLADKSRGANVLASALTLTAREAAMTECSKGHPFTEENTYEYNGARYCRICRKDYMAAYYKQRKDN